MLDPLATGSTCAHGASGLSDLGSGATHVYAYLDVDVDVGFDLDTFADVDV